MDNHLDCKYLDWNLDDNLDGKYLDSKQQSQQIKDENQDNSDFGLSLGHIDLRD